MMGTHFWLPGQQGFKNTTEYSHVFCNPTKLSYFCLLGLNDFYNGESVLNYHSLAKEHKYLVALIDI